MKCKNCNNEFTIYPEDKKFYAKIAVPEPDTCFNCRSQYLLAFWSYGQFYQRKCDKTGETIISTFPPETIFPVYKKENWLKDDWDVPEMDVDLDRPFLEQLDELQKQTPHYHLFTDGTSVNCDYCDDIYSSKNCYLTTNCAESEDLYFCCRILYCKDSFDCVYSYYLEKCYSCTRCWHCYDCKYSLESRDCLDSVFLYDCRGCKNCFMSCNLRNSEYVFMNQQYSAAQYQKKISELNLGSWQVVNRLKQDFKSMLQKQAIHKSVFNVKSTNSVGNYLDECKGCQQCFFLEKSEDCSDVLRGAECKDQYNGVGTYKTELCCGGLQCFECYNVNFSNYAMHCRDSEYLDQCDDCVECFGCVGLQKGKYRILNKEYSEKEYKELLKKIKDKMRERGEYGKFLPLSMTYNGYNESLAMIYFPMEEQQVIEWGGRWQKDLDKDVKVDIESKDLPDDIKNVELDKILNKSIECEKTGKIFRYVKAEIEYYQKNNIALPREYFMYRVVRNYKTMMPTIAREIDCFNCNKKVTTYYPLDWGYQKIYCEDCYQKEIY